MSILRKISAHAVRKHINNIYQCDPHYSVLRGSQRVKMRKKKPKVSLSSGVREKHCDQF